jgi:hypothetical protein
MTADATVPSCALERPATLDAARMVTAARTLLDGSPERVWSAFDPINGYAQPLAGHRPGRLPGSLVHPIALRKPGVGGIQLPTSVGRPMSRPAVARTVGA